MLLPQIYDRLFKSYGHQNWWPADTFDEIIIGAILTQNTSWVNVEKAINRLKKENLCTLETISKLDHALLAELIKSSGYYNQKAKRLIHIASLLNIDEIKKRDLKTARESLLTMKGIGPETADSILLYAFERPIFVIDRYTIRVVNRLGIVLAKNDYDSYQQYFMEHLEHDVKLFNEFHALFVKHCKKHCSVRPRCDNCCFIDVCKYVL